MTGLAAEDESSILLLLLHHRLKFIATASAFVGRSQLPSYLVRKNSTKKSH
jgi:hypothetical protein